MKILLNIREQGKKLDRNRFRKAYIRILAYTVKQHTNPGPLLCGLSENGLLSFQHHYFPKEKFFKTTFRLSILKVLLNSTSEYLYRSV